MDKAKKKTERTAVGIKPKVTNKDKASSKPAPAAVKDKKK